MLTNAQARFGFWQCICLGRKTSSLSPHLALRSRDLEQVEAVKPHTRSGRSVVKACWSSILRASKALVHPLLGDDKARDRAILRHGAENLGPLLVPEQVVAAIARLGSGIRQSTEFHDTLSQA